MTDRSGGGCLHCLKSAVGGLLNSSFLRSNQCDGKGPSCVVKCSLLGNILPRNGWSEDKPQEHMYPNYGRLRIGGSPAPAGGLTAGSMGCRVYARLQYSLSRWEVGHILHQFRPPAQRIAHILLYTARDQDPSVWRWSILKASKGLLLDL